MPSCSVKRELQNSHAVPPTHIETSLKSLPTAFASFLKKTFFLSKIESSSLPPILINLPVILFCMIQRASKRAVAKLGFDP